jgi:hypothetical protein
MSTIIKNKKGAEILLKEKRKLFLETLCPIFREPCKQCHSFTDGCIVKAKENYLVMDPVCTCALVTGCIDVEQMGVIKEPEEKFTLPVRY